MVPLIVSSKALLKRVSLSHLVIRNASDKHYKLVVVGGGSAGMAVASRFSRSLGKNKVALVEPSKVHYYQPMWTFVGGGMQKLADSARATKDLIPSGCEWIQQEASQFAPEENSLTLKDKSKLTYDYLVVAVGLQMNLDGVKGLREALKTDGVCSNYMADTVEKTWKCIQNFKSGNAVFTFPNTPIKCAGAPQKIMYITDAYLRKHNRRKNATFVYNTALPVIFGSPTYAAVLKDLAAKRDLNVNYKHNLIEILPEKREAVFELVDPGEKKSIKYDMLHVTPPQKAPEVVRPLADATGFVNVNKETLQHVKYSNVFSIGDCSNLPTSKTAAAVAAQSQVLEQNLQAVMKKQKTKSKYNGYTSCPVITSYETCVMCEFDYTLNPRETFPVSQRKERRSMFLITKHAVPFIYWNLMTRGLWNGPGTFRKFFHFGRD